MKVAAYCGLLSIVASILPWGLVFGFTMHGSKQLVRREINEQMDEPEVGAAENTTYGLDSNAILSDGSEMQVGDQKARATALAIVDANYHNSDDKSDGSD